MSKNDEEEYEERPMSQDLEDLLVEDMEERLGFISSIIAALFGGSKDK